MLEKASSDEPSVAELFFTDQNGSNFSSLKITCILSPPANGEIIECEVSSSKQPGKYSVEFVPQVSGLHRLYVKLNDELFEGVGPFDVPVQIRQTPRVITELRRPWMADLLDEETIVISECVGHCVTIHSYSKGRWSFGSRGSGLGEFEYPSGLAITSSGTVVVSDGLNHRIQELTVDGRCLKSVGKKGKGNLQFNQPKGITIDNDTGNLYITEYANHRVQVLDPDLNYFSTIGGSGSAPGRFSNPYTTAFDSLGHLYVADYGNHRIQKFTSDGRCMGIFGSKGSGQGELLNPVGIAIDDNDILYVTERYNHRISMFTTDGQFQGWFGKKGTSLTSFNQPYGVLSRRGRLYVCDCSNDRLCIY